MTLTLAQRDAYRRTFIGEVVACEAIGRQFGVRLRDTILYAAGGGQPADHGTIGGVDVVDVVRADDGSIVHVTAQPVVCGEAEVVVDWARRYDHMQQHSAQHLITAIADDEFGLPTISFHLGADYSAIEFGCDATPTDDTLAALVRRANEEIRACRAIGWRTVPLSEYGSLDLRSRGLPDGHQGEVRLVEIDGIDLNTCGGTHVANTGELQVVRFGRIEKTTGGARLPYFAGGRVLAQIDEWTSRDGELAELLTCSPSDFVASVTKLQGQNKELARAGRVLRAELAGRISGDILRCQTAVVALHLDDDDVAFLNTIANEVADAKLLILIGRGVFLVAGPAPIVEVVGPQVRDKLGARGGGRGGRFQGKVPAGADIDGALTWANALTVDLEVS